MNEKAQIIALRIFKCAADRSRMSWNRTRQDTEALRWTFFSTAWSVTGTPLPMCWNSRSRRESNGGKRNELMCKCYLSDFGNTPLKASAVSSNKSVGQCKPTHKVHQHTKGRRRDFGKRHLKRHLHLSGQHEIRGVP